MSGDNLRTQFLDFFKEEGHTVVPSSPLVSDDPSVLLTTAGMQQFKPYFTGEKEPQKDFGSLNTASVQKSFRTSDIDEVGDESHLTFFEMLGNFSFGGYFKEEAIAYAHAFITEELGLTISYVTIFEGNDEVPRDDISEKIWKSIDPNIEVREADAKENFWGPTGSEGPCGPTTEIYVQNAKGDDIEVWNLVFNEFLFPGTREELLSGTSEKKLKPLETPGVDTGMGLERLAMVVNSKETLFETNLFSGLLELLPGTLEIRTQRIVADHLRAVCFLIADGVVPSNKEEGYILRRLMRRIFTYEEVSDLTPQATVQGIDWVLSTYGAFYNELGDGTAIKKEIEAERERYREALQQGIRELEKVKEITAEIAFDLYQTYGLPYEVIKDLSTDKKGSFTREAFDKLFEEHQKISRAGAEKKFKGGLADQDEETVRLHTATHLMNAALRKVLGDHVWQKGSNITTERTRFDFTHGEKMTDEELAEVEKLVNEWIQANYEVKCEEMPREEAEELGAIGVFEGTYPDKVTIYTVWDPESGEVVSREFCGGPHVERTGKLGTFKIIKEQSSSAGVRRIKAHLK